MASVKVKAAKDGPNRSLSRKRAANKDKDKDKAKDKSPEVEEVPRSYSPIPRAPAFRPLQLSIYIPGNQLPDLATLFSDGKEEEDEIPPVPEIPRPSKAIMRSRSESVVSGYELNSYSVPRKPLMSRASSTDGPRPSLESGKTGASCWTQRRDSLHWSRYPLGERRPSIATTGTGHSTQDFLDILNAPLPPLPLQTLKTNTAPEPAASIFRRASEQSKRLQQHLEERQQLAPECDTILEEKSLKSPVSPLSAITPSSAPDPEDFLASLIPSKSTTPAPELLREPTPPPPCLLPIQSNRLSTNPCTSPLPSPGRPRSSTGSSTLLNASPEPIAQATATITNLPTESTSSLLPTVTTTISSTNPNIRQRLSQWLSKSLSQPFILDLPDEHSQERRSKQWHGHKRYSSSCISEMSVSVVPLFAGARTVGRRSSDAGSRGVRGRESEDTQVTRVGHEKKGSVSTYVTTRGLSLDVERFGLPKVQGVGIAM